MQPSNYKLIKPEQLSLWGWEDVTSFSLVLNDEQISFEKPVRFVPYQRMVCFSSNRAKAVYKLIYGRNALSKQQRELGKLDELLRLGIKAPRVLEFGVDGPLAWFAMEKVVGAKPLSAFSLDDRFQGLAIKILVSLYEKNVIHNDPHLDNFFVLDDFSDFKILDAAAIDFSCKKECIEKNLALFLIQIDGKNDIIFQNILDCLVGEFTLNKKKIIRHIAKAKRLQISKFVKKVCRESTAIRKIDNEFYTGLIKRSLSDEMLDQLANSLKAANFQVGGRSCSAINGYIVNVFSAKSDNAYFNARLEDKALAAWKYGSAIYKFLGVAPEPIAFLKDKDGCYFVISSYGLDGSDIGYSGMPSAEKTDEDMTSILRCLHALHRLGFYFGGDDFSGFAICQGFAVITDIANVGWAPNTLMSELRAKRDIYKFNQWRLEN